MRKGCNFWVNGNILHLDRGVGYMGINIHQKLNEVFTYIHTFYCTWDFISKKALLKADITFFALAKYTRLGKKKLFFVFHSEGHFPPSKRSSFCIH